MADIVDRLRDRVEVATACRSIRYRQDLPLMTEAADAIARQREEITRLRAALRNAADSLDDVGSRASAAEARSALSDTTRERSEDAPTPIPEQNTTITREQLLEWDLATAKAMTGLRHADAAFIAAARIAMPLLLAEIRILKDPK
jgi:hypothetical protein